MPNQVSEARRTRQRTEARRTILDATEALMIEAGGDFSIRTLAERCGYTPPTIYHYFGDKDGLIDTLLEERFSRLLEMVRALDLGPDPVANWRALALAFIRFGVENPTFYRLTLTPSRKGEDRTPLAAEAARRIMEAPAIELEKAGRLRTPNRETAQQAMWALVHGLTALRITRLDYEWAPDLAEVAIDSLLEGLVSVGWKADAMGARS